MAKAYQNDVDMPLTVATVIDKTVNVSTLTDKTDGKMFLPWPRPQGVMTMTTVFVRHQAADYSAWRRVYDAFQEQAKTLGVQSDAVYQGQDNPNEITVTHDFATPEAAQAFVASAELRAAMHDAGVVGAPTIWFAQRA